MIEIQQSHPKVDAFDEPPDYADSGRHVARRGEVYRGRVRITRKSR